MISEVGYIGYRGGRLGKRRRKSPCVEADYATR